MNEIVEAEAVEETGTEIVAPAEHGSTLFRTNDPVKVLERAAETANALMPVVRDKGLVAKIGNKDHLTVEAWQTLGAMLGVTPVCTWTRKLDNGWEARVEARTLDGRVIGAAEAECLTDESRWAKADDFAVRSMAQTRATSKALASVLRFVATLGGAAGTPAEEMPREAGGGPGTTSQKRAISTMLNKAGVPKDFQRQMVFTMAGDPPSKAGCSRILDILNEDADAASVSTRVARLIKASGVTPPSDIPFDDDEPELLEDRA